MASSSDSSSGSSPKTARTASATTDSACSEVSRRRDHRPFSRASNCAAKASPPRTRPWEPLLRQALDAQRARPHLVEEERIPLLHQPHHLGDDEARFVRRVAGLHHPVEAVKHDARHGVHHRRERADGNHVARGFDRALLGVLLDQLQALRRGGRADVPQVLQNAERVVLEQGRQLGVAVPGAQHGRLVDAESLARDGRHEGARFLQLHVPLARLLGVVERIGVQEGPHELPRDVLEPELEVRVLVDGVMPGVEGQRADGVAL